MAKVGHLQCPFCGDYDVERLYLASLQVDSCSCRSCGAQWDEVQATGAFLGRGDRASAISPRKA